MPNIILTSQQTLAAKKRLHQKPLYLRLQEEYAKKEEAEKQANLKAWEVRRVTLPCDAC